MTQIVALEQPTGEIDIDAHLMHAAMDGLSAVMQLGPSHLMGRLEIPEDMGDVVFVLDRASSIVDPEVQGLLVRVEYWHGDTSNRFESQVVEREGPRVRLVRPEVVDRSDRRLVPRFAVDGAEGFRFLVGEAAEARSLPLVDLSNTGLAFRCPLELELEPGMELVAWLGLPDHDVVPIRLEIRNSRPLGTEILVGARMIDLRRVDRKAITRLIVGIRDPSD
jgi:hypothetical protein